MRTSTTATSGLWARTLRIRSSPSAAWPTTSRPASSSRRDDALAEQGRVVGDDYSHGILAMTVVPSPAGLVDDQPAVERRDPVFEAAQPGPVIGVGAADAVVADLDLDRAVAPRDADRGAVGVGVAGDVGQRLGDHEVGRRLDRFRQPLRRRLEDLDRQRRAVGEAAERRLQPAVAEHRGVDAAGELAQLAGRRARAPPSPRRGASRRPRGRPRSCRAPAAGSSSARRGAAGRRRGGRARPAGAPRSRRRRSACGRRAARRPWPAARR